MYHRLNFRTVIGVLACSFLIGGTSSWLVFQNQKQVLSNRIAYETELQALLLESEIRRLTSTATQIANRTQALEKSKKYNHGAINQQSLVVFNRPRLEELVRIIPELKGITVFDLQRRSLSEAGEPIATPAWPSHRKKAITSLGLPYLFSKRHRIAISAPIQTQDGELIGIAHQAFSLSRINRLMAGFHRNQGSTGLALATFENSEFRTFLVQGISPEKLLRPSEISPAKLGTQIVGMFQVEDRNANAQLILHRTIGASGWIFMMVADPTKIFNSAISQAQSVAFSVLILVLVGIGATCSFIYPRLRKLDDKALHLAENNQSLLKTMQTSEALVQSIVDISPSIIYVKDQAGRYQLVNIAYEKIARLQRQEIIGKTDHELFPAEIADKFRSNDRRVLDSRSAIEVDEQAPQVDGIRDYLSVKFPLYGVNGEVSAVCGISTDITDRKAIETRLRQSAKVFESSGEGLVIMTCEGKVIDVNPAFTEIMGYEKEELVGKTPRYWKSDQHPNQFYAQMWSSIQETGQWRGEIWNRHKNGSLIPELLTIKSVFDDRGNLLNYVAVYSDISTIKTSQAKLEYLAHHDLLTDLPNRVLFNAHIAHAIDRAERHGRRLALVFLDLDQFKHINDSLGHNAGDQLLKLSADLLKQHLRKTDAVARIGGDEFTFLLEEISDSEDVIRTVEKILKAFDSEFLLGDHRLRITPSIGISLYPEDGRNAETLLRNADSAMYRAKAEGRNTYRFYTESLTARALERIRLEAGLRKAILNGELCVYFQPQYELKAGNMIGMEALLRWHHREEGLLYPGLFIPIAEDSGLIQALDDWVMRAVCQQTKSWLEQGLDIPRISINISGKDIDQGQLSSRIKNLLLEYDLDPDHLEIELTESFIMGRSKQSIEELTRLRNLGLRLAVDDFGIGYSSLAYLKKLPINRLKIDRSFIQDIPNDANDVAITEAIVALGSSLGLEIVAEGVETPAQQAFLIDIGCPYGQGFLLSRPLPAERIQEQMVKVAALNNLKRIE